MYLALALISFALAWILLILQAGAAPTWFYVIIWYPTLALMDALAARKAKRPPLIKDRARLWSLLLWSAPIWFLFEVFNFRLDNWYYVFLPSVAPERWLGITVSFATVVPAVVLVERVLDAYGVARRWRGRHISVTTRQLAMAQWLGLAILAAVLLLPRLLYPLLWGAVLLIADPFVYRRRPLLSLFSDLERGEWGRVSRLLIGGLLIGLLWESYNFWARGKWIYTVPLLDQLKLFEMPVVGFFGFPLFALEAWALYHALCTARVAIPAYHPPALTARRIPWAAAIAVVASALTIWGMQSLTISSVTPAAPVAIEKSVSGRARTLDPWTIAAMEPGTLAEQTGLSPDSAALLVRLGQLVVLKGIGTTHAAQLHRAGIFDVCHLGQANPDSLWLWIRQSSVDVGKRPTRDEVGVWVSAGQGACRR